MTPQSAGGLARAAKLSAIDRATIAQKAAFTRWKIPPAPKREPDGWKNVYQRQDGSIWEGLCQVSAQVSDFLAVRDGAGSRRLYRLRIYLKEPTP